MSNTSHYPLPGANVEPYVQALGADLAIDFLLNFGGAELSLPKVPKGKSEVERLIGPVYLLRLSEAFDGQRHRVPLATRWLAQCLSIQGLSAASIARRLRVSDVTVRKYLHGRNEPNPRASPFGQQKEQEIG